ncbi:hypothetical protein ACFYNY_36285 [Streptomyces sp. NPDC006530]|uniref:hypothetical protein n=1 Tax=Streptomyces sp. NPDC006530 TaxID=3364750 RepID=UPI0036930091
MNPVRRPLGLGPATSPTSPPNSPSRRLLPVERVVGDDQVDVVGEDQADVVGEDQAAVQPRGRRVLGPGSSTSPGVS